MKPNKNQYIYLVLLFIFLALLGCNSKKTTVETTKQSDTLITKSLNYVSQPISTTITIDEICDTLGNVRKFTQVETSGGNKAKVFTKDNTLNIDLLTGLSRFKSDTIYISEKKERDLSDKTVIYRTPLKVWFIIAAMGVIILLLLGIKIRF